MNFSHYNKFWQSSAILTIVILAVAINNPPYASAQQVGSITMRRNIEKFKEYRTTDRERALDYAKLILNDLDSTTMTLDAAMVYDFMAE
ncbi:MAG: hypothetical protein IKK89_05960, partial [Alistipes sp.]|nr:hypothetical protein [Alistipes sp.]